jgi:hypothetical protein
MQFYTLNSLINQFRYVSQNHAQIKGFNFGRDAEIAASEQENYPLLWIDVTDSNIEGTVMTVSILMKVVDIQQPDRYNEIENLSDMLSIGQDVYAAMSDPAYQDFFIIQYASSLTPIREAYTDLVNGWEMRLDFSFMQDRNRCQIPTNDIPFPPVATCPKANITLNGETFISVASGITENIELVNQDNVRIQPKSIVENVIKVERYLFTSIDTGTITPNSIYGIINGETT